MKFFNIFVHDIKVGIIYRRINLFVVSLLILCAISITISFRESGYVGNFGDYLIKCFEGSMPFRYEHIHKEYYKFPVEWLFVMSGSSIFGLSYPFEYLQSFEIQVITRVGKRTQWWLSKCIWCFLQACWYFIICCLVLGVFCVLSGGKMNLDVNSEILKNDFPLSQDIILDNLENTVLVVPLAIVLLTIVTIDFLQLTIGLYIHPVAGLLASISIFGISAIWYSPLAIGNYAMIIRNKDILLEGLSAYQGAVIEMIVIIVCIYLGNVYVRKWDMISKNT